MTRVLLYKPHDFNNLCLVARTLEVFGLTECYVHDIHRIVRDRYGKSYSRRLRVVSAGAFSRIQWIRVSDPIDLVRAHSGRSVATVADTASECLTTFRFEPSDLIVFGSEGCGLPPELVRECQRSVTIPMRGKTKSFNLAVACGIILYEAFRQLGLLSQTHGDNGPDIPSGRS